MVKRPHKEKSFGPLKSTPYFCSKPRMVSSQFQTFDQFVIEIYRRLQKLHKLFCNSRLSVDMPVFKRFILLRSNVIYFFQVLQDLRIEWHRSQAKHFIFYDYCNCQKFKSYQFITYHDISFLGYKFYGSASSSTSGALQART